MVVYGGKSRQMNVILWQDIHVNSNVKLTVMTHWDSCCTLTISCLQLQQLQSTFTKGSGGAAGPAGPALTGPLFEPT